MRTVKVDLKDRSYNITIGHGSLPDAGKAVAAACRGRRVLIVSNPVVASLYADALAAGLSAEGLDAHTFTVPAGEEYKTLETVITIYAALLDARIDRSGVVVALGGGVVGDMAGFAAATYLRGIDVVQVPTTLLAQVDSSVGGKTGVDLPQGKNLVGAFHQPKAVVIDTATLKSLPPRELRAGLAEVVKYGIITDLTFFEFLEAHTGELLELDSAVIEHAVTRSVEIKADVVSRDEKETSDLRKTLNFGHTFAHSIEVTTGYGQYLHGEAVALGMVCASEMAEAVGLAEDGTSRRIADLLCSLELPVAPESPLDVEAIVDAIQLDKKAARGKVNFVLPRRIGEVVVTDDVPQSVVRDVLARWS